jgi:hypothetical protein
VLKVLGDRTGADVQQVRDGAVRAAQGHELQDAQLALGQFR